MANKPNALNELKQLTKKATDHVDVNAIKKNATAATKAFTTKAGELKESAVNVKEDISNKITELDRMLDQAITEYNEAYTLMNDKGIQLYIERCRSTDLITFVENLVNSIANRPKYFDAEFEEINANRKVFTDSCSFANRELQAARTAASGAGAGLAAGASVAFMGPTAAMWIATTFGTASTGTAISALSGAAATNAALAWLGGGALVAGGHGMAAGQALLALAGPVGWTIAGASLLGSIALFTTKKVKLNKEKNEEIEKVKRNTEAVKETDLQINRLLTDTCKIRNGLNDMFMKAASLSGQDYLGFSSDQKQLLGALVNTTKALSVMFGKTIQ